MTFDISQLKKILVCPACHGDMIEHKDALVDVSPECRRSYPVLHSIPRLLVSDSAELSVEAWGKIMSQHNRDPKTGAVSTK